MFDKKILCLGSNKEGTDQLVSSLAANDLTVNHGLITDTNKTIVDNGYYHTSITDLSFGDIIEIADQFDEIKLLDQPIDEWDHWRSFLTTHKVLMELENIGHKVIYRDNTNFKSTLEFVDLVNNNKSFCIYPWISWCHSSGGTNLTLCARSPKPVVEWKKLGDWQTNAEFSDVRQKMLAGEMLPEHCRTCYEYEERGIESYRQYETKDWLTKLKINSVDDLNKITSPKFYDLRLSNKCNIMCRSCKPEYSHLIEREHRLHKTFPLAVVDNFEYSTLDEIKIEDLTNDCQVYLTGGEPTVISDVYRFMENCIAKGKTDFDFTLGTNAVKLSEKFIELSSHFTNMNFSISLDGYGKINDYWRWGSDWGTVIANTKKLESMGHSISINTVPGIYNITNLHLLYEFLDKEFPHTTVYLQANYHEFQAPWHHPDIDAVLESMRRCKQTKMYYSDGKSNKTMIDSFYDFYSNSPNIDLGKLKQFFEFNDKLDQVRGSKLGDYIPELEACRHLI